MLCWDLNWGQSHAWLSLYYLIGLWYNGIRTWGFVFILFCFLVFLSGVHWQDGEVPLWLCSGITQIKCLGSNWAESMLGKHLNPCILSPSSFFLSTCINHSKLSCRLLLKYMSSAWHVASKKGVQLPSSGMRRSLLSWAIPVINFLCLFMWISNIPKTALLREHTTLFCL